MKIAKMLQRTFHTQGVFSLDGDYDDVFEALEKSGAKSLPPEKLRGKIFGTASTEHVDTQKQIVSQDGIDWSFAQKGGAAVKLTYEHPVGVQNWVGEIAKIEKSDVDGIAATTIEGFLYLSDPFGKEIYQKAYAAKQAGGSAKLGFSVEGGFYPSAVSVLPDGVAKITKSFVHSVAITPVPRNPYTWWETLAASLASDPTRLDFPEDLVLLLEKAGFSRRKPTILAHPSPEKLTRETAIATTCRRLDVPWSKAEQIVDQFLCSTGAERGRQ